ncbi:hypothetical protein GCM10010512_04860 [Streptomyces thermoviolaceus subsp. thermoviolaceus]|nr:hypothetical protein GCM10010512_04860 [Streptomyces thermoviolaceus subsp. thermoviolaceus]
MRSATGVILLLIPAVTVIRRRTAGRGNDKSDDRRGRTTRATGTTSAASDRGNGNDERGKNDTSDRNDDDQDTVATRAGRFKARSHGVHGGFTTMVTNAGGPVTL